MKKISKAVYTKSLIAASVLFCIGMGQNCAQPQFSAIDAASPVAKDGGAPVPTTSTATGESGTPMTQSHTQSSNANGSGASNTNMTGSSESTGTSGTQQSATTTPPASGTIQDLGNQSPNSNSSTQQTSTGQQTTSSADSSADCMKIEKIDNDHLKKCATFDDDDHDRDHKPSKILVCHHDGNSGHSHELLLPTEAVTAHLAHHGDYLGACGQPAVASCQPKTDSDDDHKVAKHDDDDKDDDHGDKDKKSEVVDHDDKDQDKCSKHEG